MNRGGSHDCSFRWRLLAGSVPKRAARENPDAKVNGDQASSQLLGVLRFDDAVEAVLPVHRRLPDESFHAGRVDRNARESLIRREELGLDAGELAQVRAPLL